MEVPPENLTLIPTLDDFKLIELVRLNKPLYDKNHADYRDLIKKNIIWKAISVALAVPEEICRKRFRCLRDRFNKERKVRKDLMLTDPSVPPIFKKMLFLWEFCTHRRRPPSFIKFKNENPDEAEALEKELEKQYRILRGEELSDEDPSDEHSVNDEGSNDMVMCINQEEKSSEHDNDKQEGVYCTYVVADSSYENNGPVTPAQIIFVPSENSSEKNNNEDSSTHGANIIIMSSENTETDNANKQPCNEDQSSDSPQKIGENGTSEKSNDNNKDVAENLIVSDQKRIKTPTVNKIRGRVLYNKIGRPRKRKNIPHKHDHFTENNSIETDKNSDTLSPKKFVGGSVKNEQIFKPSCNDAFCAIVKSYLDKISNPERLSSARLQILTILHNELYSTYC